MQIISPIHIPISSKILTIMAKIVLVMKIPKRISVMRVIRFILRISWIVRVGSMEDELILKKFT